MKNNMNEEMQRELRLLSHEMLLKREKIRQEWHLAHPSAIRGTVSTPEMKAINDEEKQRFEEILKKYKK